MRPKLVVSALAALFAALPAPVTAVAEARGRPVACNLVRDAQGDATMLLDDSLVTGPNAPGLDIRSVDIASDKTWLTGVIRVTDLAHLVWDAPSGAAFHLELLGRRGFDLIAITTPTRTAFRLRAFADDHAVTGPHIRGTFDVPKNEVRITVALRAFGGAIRPGTRVHLALAESRRLYGVYQPGAPPVDTPVAHTDEQIGPEVRADGTSSTADYVAGRPSCVRVGV